MKKNIYKQGFQQQTTYRQIVVVSAFILSGNKLLIVKRSSSKKFLPNVFEIPGGKMEFGESPQEALKREVHEEVGIKVNIKEAPFHVFSYTSKKDNWHAVEIDFLANLKDHNPKITLNPEEHIEYKWISQAEIKSCFKGNNNIAIAAEKAFLQK